MEIERTKSAGQCWGFACMVAKSAEVMAMAAQAVFGDW